MREIIMGDGEYTLTKNVLKNFILRVDLLKSDIINYTSLADKLAVNFDRSEKKQIKKFKLKFTQDDSEMIKEDNFDHVLISEDNNVTLTFSETQNAFWIQSNQYRDNTVYKNIIQNIIEAFNIVSPEIQAKRIGMRYINEFKCSTIKGVSNIYGKRLSTIVKQMLKEPEQSRLIGMEEYNSDGYKIRFQYGIPNKFYPSVISVFDLLMDIDSYVESTIGINEWEEIIVNLNHSAYKKFSHEINEKYLKELK